jgi:hypothetical protein
VGSFKNLLLQNHRARRAHIYMKAFWCNVDSSLYKPWSPGVGRGHNRENHISMCLHWKKIFYSRTSKPISIKLNFACVYVQNISQYDSGERCGPWASCLIMAWGGCKVSTWTVSQYINCKHCWGGCKVSTLTVNQYINSKHCWDGYKVSTLTVSQYINCKSVH